MTFLKKYRWPLLGVTAVLALVLVGAAVLPMAAFAQGVPWDRMSQRGFPGDFPNAPTNHSQDLADALGITLDELEAAQQEVFDATLAQAVADGKLTQERADQIKERSGMARFAFGMIGRFGHFGDDSIDRNALLADALNITVAELEAAQETARDAALSQAVEDGKLSPEQVEQMTAMHDLMNYFQEQGVPEQMKAVIENAVKAAVGDGVITQDQADEFLSHDQSAFGKGFGPSFPGMSAPNGRSFPGLRDFGERFPGIRDFGERDGGERGRQNFRGFGGRNFTPPTN